TPLQDVHVQPRCVRELQEEELVGGDGADRRELAATGQHVKTVEAQPERGVIGAADDAPRVLVGVDESPPRECLVGDAKPTFAGTCGQFVEVFGGKIVVVDRVR